MDIVSNIKKREFECAVTHYPSITFMSLRETLNTSKYYIKNIK